MKNKFAVAVSIIVSALIFLSISQAKPVNEKETFKVKSGGTLYLESDSGSVDVQSHGKDTVEVLVKMKGDDADSFNVTYEQDGNDIKIEGERDRSFFNRSSNVRFIIKIPSKYNVDLDTGGGSIELSDLNGTVQAHTSGGSISLGRIKGDVKVKTSGGSIRVEEVAGNINAHTSGGSIKAMISKQPTDDCRLTTSGGSVTAYLLPSIKVDLSASTSGGRVRSEFTVNGSVSKRSIQGEINGGGPDLVLKTSGGSVNIKEI
jgi:DUF4097 and DUF4098 domain-containing protein YvlB